MIKKENNTRNLLLLWVRKYVHRLQQFLVGEVPGLGEEVVVVQSNFRESVECLPDYPISSGSIKNRVRSIYP